MVGSVGCRSYVVPKLVIKSGSGTTEIHSSLESVDADRGVREIPGSFLNSDQFPTPTSNHNANHALHLLIAENDLPCFLSILSNRNDHPDSNSLTLDSTSAINPAISFEP